MSVLVSEPPQAAKPLAGSEAATVQRIVDVPTRLHAWSLPLPCCIHGHSLDERCIVCDGDAPVQVQKA